MGITREQRQNIRQWVEELRSGKFAQGKSFLHKHVIDGPDEFCCLGVAGYTCKLPSKRTPTNIDSIIGTISYSFFGSYSASRPTSRWMMEQYGMNEAFTSLLMTFNDGDTINEIPAMSFKAIAQIIENWALQQPTVEVPSEWKVDTDG